MHQEIQPAELVFRGVEQPVQLVDLADVGLDQQRSPPERPDLRCCLFRRRPVAEDIDSNITSQAGEVQNNGVPDAVSPADHQEDIIFEGE